MADISQMSDTDLMKAAKMDIPTAIKSVSKKFDIPEDLLHKMVKTESGGNQSATSPKGARGIMQLMPGTAKDLGVNLNDPIENIYGGAKYLKQQKDKFGSWDRALWAYNAGPGKVEAHVMPIETRKYLRDIAGATPKQMELARMSNEELLNLAKQRGIEAKPQDPNQPQIPPPRPVEGPLPPGARPPEQPAKVQPNIDLTMGLDKPVQVRAANTPIERAGEITNRTAEGAVKAGYNMVNAPLQTLRQVVGGVLSGNKDQAIDPLAELGAGAIQGAARTAGALTRQNEDFARDPGGTLLNAGLMAKGAERPVKALAQVPGALRQGVASGLKSLSERAYESALKVPPSVPIEERAGVVRTGIENRVNATRGGLEKNRSAIDDLNKQVASKIDELSIGGNKISVADAVKTVDELKEFYQNLPPDVAAQFTGPLDELKQAYLSGGDSIGIKAAQKMKQTIYALHRKHYGELKAAETEGHKAVARGLKEKIAEEHPELNELNKEESKRIGLDEFLERAVNRSRNWNIISLGGAIMAVGGEVAGGPVGAALGMMLRHMADTPWFKSKLSFMLDRASRMVAKKAEATGRENVPVGKWENAEVPAEQKLLPAGQGFVMRDPAQVAGTYSPTLAGDLAGQRKLLPAPDESRPPRAPATAQVALKESEIENSRLPRAQKDALLAELRKKQRPPGPSQAPPRSAQEAARVRTNDITEPLKPAQPKPKEPTAGVEAGKDKAKEVVRLINQTRKEARKTATDRIGRPEGQGVEAGKDYAARIAAARRAKTDTGKSIIDRAKETAKRDAEAQKVAEKTKDTVKKYYNKRQNKKAAKPISNNQE